MSIRLAAALGAVVLSTAVLASAATLGGVTTARLAAGGAPVSACDEDGASVEYTYDGTEVAQVVVAGLDPLCEGGRLHITLASATGAALAGGSATVSAGSATVELAQPAVAADVEAVHIAITGGQ